MRRTAASESPPGREPRSHEIGQAPSPAALSAAAELSLVSFAGPFLVIGVIRGGENSHWPPDRPVEWLATGFLPGGVSVSCSWLASAFASGICRSTKVILVPELPGRDDDVER